MYCWYLVPDRVGWCWAGRWPEEAPPAAAKAVIVVASLSSDAPVLFAWGFSEPSAEAIAQWRAGLEGFGWTGGRTPIRYHRADVAFRGGITTRWNAA